MTSEKSSSSKAVSYGMIGEFSSPRELLQAAKALQQEGYMHYDAHSPFPIHGIDKVMQIKDSRLGWIVAFFALIGFLGAVTLQVWSMSIAYPFVISGKPLRSFEAFVPITFELTVLLSAFGATFGMIALNKLPRWYHPIFKHPTFKKASSHAFFISIQSTDAKYHVEATEKLLRSLGATHIEEVTD